MAGSFSKGLLLLCLGMARYILLSTNQFYVFLLTSYESIPMWDMTNNSNSKLTKVVCQAICFLVFIKRSPFFKTKMTRRQWLDGRKESGEQVFLLLHHITSTPPTHVLIFLASALLMPFSCHSLSFLMDVCISYDM